MITLLQNKPYDLGRYIIFPHTDDTKTFFTAEKGKGIDLDSDKVFEVFNGNVQGRNIMRHERLNSRTLDLPKKEKAITILNIEHNIFPHSPSVWTFIFSVQPNIQTNLTETVEIYCFDPSPDIDRRIRITWDQNGFRYPISG